MKLHHNLTGKVLQDSQENNARLKQEIEQLKSSLLQKGPDTETKGVHNFKW